MNILQRLFLCCQADTLSKIWCICLVIIFFIREIDETVDKEEEFITHKKVIKSPHDINSYISLTLKDDSIETLSQLFSTSYEKSDVGTKVPWHVVEECNVVVDMSSLGSKMDITVDRWNWILSKIYVVLAESRGGPYKKRNVATHFRIVKRIHICKEVTDLKKTIVMLCTPSRNATGKSSFDEADKHAVISYSFDNTQSKISHLP